MGETAYVKANKQRNMDYLGSDEYGTCIPSEFQQQAERKCNERN